VRGDRDPAARYLENWQDEVDSAAEYQAMAVAEPDPRLAKVYANLSRRWRKAHRVLGETLAGA
jgi:hypothetical protein